MAEKQASEKRKKSQPQPLSRQTKILTTAAILFGNLVYGCSFNTISPALDNMRSKYGTTIEAISVVFTIGIIMYCCGAVLCGFISHYINRQLVVIFAITVLVTALYIIPYCPTITMFFVCGGMIGCSAGLHDSSQMVWMIEIWQQKAGPFIQAQHFFYAIGTVIPTVIVAPFLNKNVNTTDSSITDTSTMHIPFLIIGTLGSLALLNHLLLFTFYRYHTPPMYANENFELIDDAKNVPSPIETELRWWKRIDEPTTGDCYCYGS
ncbi:hypothetical protein HA402_005906 [Bradysia odoriphaga]|nr:hypothetical protein HA402_005906 [Bradysia odoriphaga]